MRLISYKVENFRSIVNSREIGLSNDNINVLIGQNESGKSSLLEGLAITQTKNVNNNDLRADNLNPKITCTYKFNDIKEIEEYINDEGFVLYGKIKDELIKRNLILSIDYLFTGTKFLANTFTDEMFSLFLEEIKDEIIELEETTTEEVIVEKEDGTTQMEIKKDNYMKTSNDFLNIIYDLAPDILLFQDNSLLPADIDLEEIKDEKSKVKGKIGVNNFLKLTGITITQLEDYNNNKRIISTQIERACNELSDKFSTFWTQTLGKKDKISISMEVGFHGADTEKAGKPYLSFWIKDKNGNNTPEQRSKGVRWYISFFLQMQYYSENFEGISRVILIDEPGANLHAKAQKDILKMFEETSKSFQIIYATHSPFLIDTDKIYRILAVERDEEKNGESNTKVYDFHKLGSASEDTLTPLYTHMGVSLGHQEVIKEYNNIILEEVSAFFYIKSILKILDYQKEVHLLPATGANNIPKLCNLLLGWGINFGVLLDDDKKGREVLKEITNSMVVEEGKAIKIKSCDGIEDIFSKSDFCKHILKRKVTFGSDKISKFLSKSKDDSKVLLAKNLFISVNKGEISKTDFSEGTINNFKKLVEYIEKIID